MARTTITVPDDMLASAARLGVNVSEAAREGLRAAVERATVTAALKQVYDEAADAPIDVDSTAVASALREIRRNGEGVASQPGPSA